MDKMLFCKYLSKSLLTRNCLNYGGVRMQFLKINMYLEKNGMYTNKYKQV
jgi:hypothetical protein